MSSICSNKLAVVKHLKLQASDEYFKEVKVGKSKFKRYSVNALNRINDELPKLNIDQVWEENKPTGR